MKRLGKWIGLFFLALFGFGLFGFFIEERLAPEPDLTLLFPAADTQALAVATNARDGAAFASLIANGADIGAKGKDGLTLLQWRVLRGDLGGARWLLDRGADPNQQGRFGETAMHQAAMFSNTPMLKLLLDYGGDPNARAERMARPPLFNALGARRDKSVDLLLARGADIEFADSTKVRPLLLAARINHFDAVVKLLQAGADPLARDDLGADFQSAFFRTDPNLLNRSASNDRAWVIRYLEERGIAVNPSAYR